MEILQAVKKLNSISRAQLNFRRRPILCTTLYRNPIQASNFGGTFDQLFLWIFFCAFHRRCLSTFSIPWCKKVKNDQHLKSMGSCLKSCSAKYANTVFPRLTPLASYFSTPPLRRSCSIGGLIQEGELFFQCHLFTSDGTKFIWNLCKTKLFMSKKKKKTRLLVCMMMSSPGSYSREGVIFSKLVQRGGS